MSNKSKVLSNILCALFALTLFCGCAKKEPTFTLNQTEIQLKSGETLTLTVSFENLGTDPYGISWESSNNDVATVKSGIVTGVSEGSAVIKARVNIYANSKTTTGELFCNVTVTGTPNLESITFSEPTKTVAPGSTVLLVPDLNPNGSTARLLWTSSDETIATVDENGLVTAVKEGTVTIVVSAEETSIVATCTITVSDAAPVENDVLTLNRTRIELYPGESFYLKVVSGSTGTPTWASSNPTLATVSASGRVTANSVGTVTITATENGKSASCTLTVIPRSTQQTTQTTQPSSQQPTQEPSTEPSQPDTQPTETTPSPTEQTSEE